MPKHAIDRLSGDEGPVQKRADREGDPETCWSVAVAMVSMTVVTVVTVVVTLVWVTVVVLTVIGMMIVIVAVMRRVVAGMIVAMMRTGHGHLVIMTSARRISWTVRGDSALVHALERLTQARA
jgi:uncharacterized membrane protein